MLPDPLENLERRIDEMAFDLGVDEHDKMKCAGCGNVFLIVDLMPSSSRPDALPLCEGCLRGPTN